MSGVVLATCRDLPGLDPDDRPLLDALAARGVEARVLAWDEPSADWSAAGLVVIRSTWDYHERHDEFIAWARRVDAATALWNPADVVAWNADKRYLRGLAEAGIPTVPTRWIEPGATASLVEVVEETGWERLVVKPAVSAGARGTVRLFHEEAEELQDHLDALLARGAVMVQPYLERIEEDGEISVLWIDGAVTHAVRKRPQSGDFRVQARFGGQEERIEVDDALTAAADAALAHAEGCRYARVDLVPDGDGGRLLIELELVEPSLFLRHAPEAAERLADAIARHLDDSGATA
jgi:glutathione synthase/RimK-type ligase-like ATP-grasp enzyme